MWSPMSSSKPLQGTSVRKFRRFIIMNHDDGICNKSCDTCAVAQECVGSSDLEVNPEAHAMRVSRPGTGMSMTHLHPEGKP